MSASNAPVHRLRVGDRAPDVIDRLTTVNADGEESPMTFPAGTTFQFVATGPASITASASVAENTARTTITWSPGAGSTDVAGTYTYVWKATYPDARIQTIPSAYDGTLVIAP